MQTTADPAAHRCAHSSDTQSSAGAAFIAFAHTSAAFAAERAITPFTLGWTTVANTSRVATSRTGHGGWSAISRQWSPIKARWP